MGFVFFFGSGLFICQLLIIDLDRSVLKTTKKIKTSSHNSEG